MILFLASILSSKIFEAREHFTSCDLKYQLSSNVNVGNPLLALYRRMMNQYFVRYGLYLLPMRSEQDIDTHLWAYYNVQSEEIDEIYKANAQIIY